MRLESKKPVAAASLCENSACDIGIVHKGEEGYTPEITYTHRVDDDLASERAKHRARTHEELAADKVRDLPLGAGLSMRMPMAGQCENDQFPYSTGEDGKPYR